MLAGYHNKQLPDKTYSLFWLTTLEVPVHNEWAPALGSIARKHTMAAACDNYRSPGQATRGRGWDPRIPPK